MLNLFDQRQDIAHTQNTTGYAIRIEGLQCIGFFTHSQEFDRLTGDMPYRQRRAATSITVGLSQDNPGQRQHVIKGFSRVSRILTCHRIHGKQGFDRVNGSVKLLDFGHHVGINMQATCGINDNYIYMLLFCMFDRTLGNIDGVLVCTRGKKFYSNLRRQGLQLLDRRRAIDIGRDNQDRFFLTLFQPTRQLSNRSRLTRALQTRHHHNRRRLGSQVQLFVSRTHHLDQFFIDDFNECLTWTQTATNLLPDSTNLDAINKRLHHRQGNIRLQQCHPHFPKCALNILFGQLGLAGNRSECMRQTIRQIIEHSVPLAIENG